MPGPFESLPRVHPNDPIAADDYNKQSDAIDRLRLSGGPGVLVNQTTAGPSVSVINDDVGLWARVVSKATSGSATYFGWIELFATTGGGWVDGYQSGTASSAVGSNGAFEVNGNNTVPLGTLGNTLTGGTTQSSGGSVVWMTYNPTCACWSFLFSACS